MIDSNEDVDRRDKSVTIDEWPRIRERVRGRRIIHCPGTRDRRQVPRLSRCRRARVASHQTPQIRSVMSVSSAAQSGHQFDRYVDDPALAIEVDRQPLAAPMKGWST